MTTTASSRIVENTSGATRVSVRENMSMGSKSKTSASARASSHSRSTTNKQMRNFDKINGMDGEEQTIMIDGDTYVGTFTLKNGKPEGDGTITYATNDVYTGRFEFGKPHGLGKMMYERGDSYEGIWQNGRVCGIGKYTSVRGSIHHTRSIAAATA